MTPIHEVLHDRQRYHLDHVAIAVPRITDTLPLYLEILNGRFITGGDNRELGFRGVQFEYSGGKIEILEPLSGSQFLAKFFATRPNGGLHHVTFTVDDLPSAVRELESSGYHVLGVPQAFEWWSEVFLALPQTNSVLVQIAQKSSESAGRGLTLARVLSGRGNDGDGTASPGYRPPTNSG